MTDMSGTRHNEGSITVFFALLLTLAAAVICTSIEAARCRAVSYFAAQAQESALESVFAGYYRPLWESYHLFFMAEGPGLVSEIEDYLSYYEASEVFPFCTDQTEILELETAVDNGGAPFLEEICEDMKNHGKASVISGLSAGKMQIEEALTVSDYIEKLSAYGETAGKIEEQYTYMKDQGRRLQEKYGKLEEAFLTGGMTKEAGRILAEEIRTFTEEVSGCLDEEYADLLKLIKELEIQVEQEKETLQEEQINVSEEAGMYMEESLEDLMEYTEEDGDRNTAARLLKDTLAEKTEELKALADFVEMGFEKNGEEEKQEELDILTEKISHGREELAAILGEENRSENMGESSLLDSLKKWKNEGILALVLEDPESVSKAVLPEGEYPSETALAGGEKNSGSPAPFLEEAEEKGLSALYMAEHFGYWGNEKENTVLSYEAEYILGNSDNDRDNLAAAAEKILAVRSGMNFLYLLGDREKNLEAEALAAALVGFTGILPLVRLTAKVILGAWAFTEAINDAKRLFAGGDVPLVKTGEDWKVSLTGAADVLEGMEAEAAGTGERTDRQQESWNYERYLQLLFLLGNGKNQILRTMDAIEANMQQKDTKFFMENCVSYAQVTTGFHWERYTFQKNAVYGYLK